MIENIPIFKTSPSLAASYAHTLNWMGIYYPIHDIKVMDMHFHEWQVMGSRFITKNQLMQVIKLIEEGKIKPVVTKTFPFEQANEALNALRSRTTLGRIVLTF